MKPILKWTGGKSSELPEISKHLPQNFNRIVEPFLGGGAFYFNQENSNSIVNDFSAELIAFYKIIQNHNKLNAFVKIINAHQKIRNDFKSKEGEPLSELEKYGKSVITDTAFSKILDKEISSKIKSMAKINQRAVSEGTPVLSPQEVSTFNTTCLLAAHYYYCRLKYNLKNSAKALDVEHIAYWFIMRELAYSGMFRFSANGFNVPYGGASYNNKNLTTKTEEMVKLNSQPFYKNTTFENMDFQELFSKYNYFNDDDFIFLDPPYDSAFSQYNKEEDFTQQDQIRLRDCLLRTTAKIMVVIKETEFITSLYKKDFKIKTFSKNYSVNFRNRNDQAVVHLIITNY